MANGDTELGSWSGKGQLRTGQETNGILDPEGEMGQGVQAIRALIVVEKAAAVAPAAASVLCRLGRLPFPGPVELNRRTALGRKVANELHVGVVLQIGVRMELARDQVIQLFRIGRMCKGQSREHGIGHFGQGCRHSIDSRRRDVAGLSLSHDKRKLEGQFIVVGQAQKERRDCGGHGQVRILAHSVSSLFFFFYFCQPLVIIEDAGSHLDIFDGAIIASITPGRISGSGKRIRGEVQQHPISRVDDRDIRHGN